MSVTLYSMQEVALRNGKNGGETWIVIKDKVYNVTPYLEDHPGGKELISDYAGKDATKVFSDFGHSKDAKNILAKYLVGELVEEERKSNKTKSPKITKLPETPKVDVNGNSVTTTKTEVINIPLNKNRGFLYYITCGKVQ